jgi:hypothetical protein
MSVGLAVKVIEGLRAFLSRRPIALVSASFCRSPLLLLRADFRDGDRLRARSRISGCALARLAFVGAWKEGLVGERR